jgi:molecular chaperone GrpE (heat shock protein)
MDAVNSALQALQLDPNEKAESDQLKQAQNGNNLLLARLKEAEQSLERARAEADDARKRMIQQTEELEKLRARLRSFEKPQ